MKPNKNDQSKLFLQYLSSAGQNSKGSLDNEIISNFCFTNSLFSRANRLTLCQKMLKQKEKSFLFIRNTT